MKRKWLLFVLLAVLVASLAIGLGLNTTYALQPCASVCGPNAPCGRLCGSGDDPMTCWEYGDCRLPQPTEPPYPTVCVSHWVIVSTTRIGGLEVNYPEGCSHFNVMVKNLHDTNGCQPDRTSCYYENDFNLDTPYLCCAAGYCGGATSCP